MMIMNYAKETPTPRLNDRRAVDRAGIPVLAHPSAEKTFFFALPRGEKKNIPNKQQKNTFFFFFFFFRADARN